MKTFTLLLKSHTDVSDIELTTKADKFSEAANYFYEQLNEEFDRDTIEAGMYED